MNSAAFVFAIPLTLALTVPSPGCDLIAIDSKTGEPIPFPTLDESIATSQVAFVGRVQGFRTDDTKLLNFTPSDSPVCSDDATWEQCSELLSSVISVVFDVEHEIKGVEAGRLYEEYYTASDGGCGPFFEMGKRYVRADGIFGVEELPSGPTEEQLAHWRAVAAVQ